VNLNTIHVCLLKLSIRKFDCSRHIYTCCKIIRYLGIQKLHVSQFYRLYLFRIDRKNINDTICSNVDYHNILFALMHQIVEKELPVQAKPAKVNNNSKRPCKHVYFLLCKSCFCCTSFVLDIDNTNIIKNVLLAERK